MINYKIEEIAHNYVESFGEILPGFKYGFANLKEFSSKYYFDFIIKRINDKVPKKPPFVGGSPGFTIDKKTLEIENLTFAELAMLKTKEEQLKDAYNKIKNIKDNNSSLYWLKANFDLNSKQLLQVKKIIDETEFDKETVLEQINRIIKMIANKA